MDIHTYVNEDVDQEREHTLGSLTVMNYRFKGRQYAFICGTL
jgi:hypothetical protein